jgi:hypothetical protein
VEAVVRHYPHLEKDRILGELRDSTYVSLTHRYLYFAIPKAACTSLKLLIHQLEGCPPLPDFDAASDEPRRDMLIHVREHLPVASLVDLDPRQQEEVLHSPDFLRFTVVRNPYTRLISAWRNKVFLCEPGFVHLYSRIRGNMPPTLDKSPILFEEFLQYIEDDGNVSDCDGHWRLQRAYCFYEAMNFNFIGKAEDIGEVANRLAAHLEIPNGVLEVPRVNASVGPSGSPLTGSLARRVQALYQADFDTFGYNPDSWRQASASPAGEESYYDEIIERNITIERLHNEISKLRREISVPQS